MHICIYIYTYIYTHVCKYMHTFIYNRVRRKAVEVGARLEKSQKLSLRAWSCFYHYGPGPATVAAACIEILIAKMSDPPGAWYKTLLFECRLAELRREAENTQGVCVCV